ncbi:MAG: YcxB family protein [Oscillospiraceae bacterium]|nr:YcxB family protein [Oscillospiraceae bacterium]
MEFAFETVYNQKTLTAMAKAVRKTTRAKRSRKSRIAAGFFILLGTVLIVNDILNSNFDFKTFITLLAVAAMVFVLPFEDSLNAYLAGKRMVSGTETARVEFKADSFVSRTEAGTTEFNYTIIQAVAETGDYIIFVLDKNHAQAYDVTSIVNGTKEQFIEFIEQKTGKKVQKI